VILLLSACCGSPAVNLGPPHDRYDHNRTLIINEWEYMKWDTGAAPVRKTVQLDRLNRDAVYTPRGHEAAPRAAEPPKGKDGLPAAHLVPVYTGVALPLSSEPVAEVSDREDLIDYLGQGGLAHQGVEVPDMPAALPQETEKKFRLVLELLSSKERLESRARVLEWAEKHALESTFRIVDSRYLAVSFADRVALEHHGFWFVLFRLPDTDAYTRLVVVPSGTDADRVKKPVEGGD